MKDELELIFPEGHWLNDEYQIRCPFCGDKEAHFHCSINVRKKVFHCWLCDEKGNLNKLLRHIQIDKGLGIQYPVYHQEKKQVKNLIDFKNFMPIIGQLLPFALQAKKYLNDRNITDQDVLKYDIRYGDIGKFAGYVIFPIYGELGAVIYFVARAFVSGVKPKYLYPSENESLLGKSQTFFKLQWGRQDIIIVEGIFDAFGVIRKIPNISAVAILGKNISDAQRAILLMQSPRHARFYIMLDADAALKSGKKIAEILKGCRGRQVFLCHLKRGDPDSAPNDKVYDAFLEAKEIGREDFHKQKLREFYNDAKY